MSSYNEEKLRIRIPRGDRLGCLLSGPRCLLWVAHSGPCNGNPFPQAASYFQFSQMISVGKRMLCHPQICCPAPCPAALWKLSEEAARLTSLNSSQSVQLRPLLHLAHFCAQTVLVSFWWSSKELSDETRPCWFLEVYLQCIQGSLTYILLVFGRLKLKNQGLHRFLYDLEW